MAGTGIRDGARDGRPGEHPGDHRDHDVQYQVLLPEGRASSRAWLPFLDSHERDCLPSKPSSTTNDGFIDATDTCSHPVLPSASPTHTWLASLRPKTGSLRVRTGPAAQLCNLNARGAAGIPEEHLRAGILGPDAACCRRCPILAPNPGPPKPPHNGLKGIFEQPIMDHPEDPTVDHP